MEKTICELFAGVGGFRLGLEKSSKDWRTVWFSQWEPGRTNQWAHGCYVGHWGDIDENTGMDIAKVDKKTIPDHNLLVGGFPCQDYSVAKPLSESEGISGKKGVLWWQIAETMREKKTPFVLLENVDRLLKSPASQRGRDFGIMLACFAELGYNVEWRVVNAAEYGATQRRRRVFIFAAHSTTNYSAGRANFTAIEIMERHGFFARAFPISQYAPPQYSSVKYTDIPLISESFTYNFKNAGYMKNGRLATTDVTPVFEEATALKSILQRNVPDKYYIRGNLEKWEYLKGAKRVEREHKNGHKYMFSEGAIAFPEDLDMPARTILTSEASLNRSTHVIEDPETGKLRLLTPVETERIQGFDDEWTNSGMPEKFRYFCMGNALVVPMISRMGKVLNEIFEVE